MADSGEQSSSKPGRRPRPPVPSKKAEGKAPKQLPDAKERPARDYNLSFEEKQVIDYVRMATRKNVWYYRDRLNVPRGPCSLPVLRECWVHGIIDESTLVWGQGLMDWLPIKNVRTLVPQIRTLEVQLATWVKRQIALKPALERIRKDRQEKRVYLSNQVDNMY